MSEKTLLNAVWQTICKAKDNKPLAPSMTNIVTAQLVANAQLAAGGAAAMFHMSDEGEALSAISGALYINVGTMMGEFASSMPAAARAFKAAQKPWVLDPVGVGLGGLRGQILADFKLTPPSIVRANASEVIALNGVWGVSPASSEAEKNGANNGQNGGANGNLNGGQNGDQNSGPLGVESTAAVAAAEQHAKSLALFINGAVAVSGEVDFITDGSSSVRCYGGSALMPLITGMGCALGGVSAVYAAVSEPFIAALAASVAFSAAGNIASQKASAPASFALHFIDTLYNLNESDILGTKIEIL